MSATLVSEKVLDFTERPFVDSLFPFTWIAYWKNEDGSRVCYTNAGVMDREIKPEIKAKLVEESRRYADEYMQRKAGNEVGVKP